MSGLISPSPEKPKNDWHNVIGALLKSIGVPVPWDPIPPYQSSNPRYNPAPIPTGKPIPTPTPTGKVLGDKTALDFNTLMEIMAQKTKDRGFNQAIPISQMAAESQRGKSRRAIDDNNLFGLAVYNDNSPGLKFKTPQESMDYYLNLVEKDPRYTEAYQQRATPSAYLDALLRIPYATDPGYRAMITNTPEYRKYINQ
jgi:flagellum-specific peptidoglycan hydrolase FlgJ